MNLTSIDLSDLCERVARDLGTHLLVGDQISGKTAVRDSVTNLLGCSQVEAEQLVETLAARNFMRYLDQPGQGGPGAWQMGR